MYLIISSIHGQDHVPSPTFRSIVQNTNAVRSHDAEGEPLFYSPRLVSASALWVQKKK